LVLFWGLEQKKTKFVFPQYTKGISCHSNSHEYKYDLE
jgi:hypothetical protein